MRSALVVCLISELFLGRIAMAQAISEGTASVTGVVTGAEGPIVVYLQSDDENPTRYYDGYQATTVKDGKFSFEEIRPGTYHLWAQATGFVSASASDDKGNKIILQPHERRTGVTIALVHRRALCGRVTENGIPKQTWVTTLRYDPIRGTFTKTFLPSTNKEDGSYRFEDLEPGTYYLQAYMTWYPGSFSFNGAKPVILGRESGPTTCSLDIPLQYTGCHAYKVNGRIGASPDGGNQQQYRVTFLERNANGGSVPDVTATNSGLYKSGDSFSINVCSGEYDVALTDPGGRGYVVFDSKPVSVGSTDVDGVVLTPQPMASIQGTVHFEDITRSASCPGIGGQTVEISGAGGPQFQSVRLDDKGHFEFNNVAPSEYTVSLSLFRREVVYLKSISVDGKPAQGRSVSIPQAAPVAIDITLSGDLAHAEGHLPPDLHREHRWEVAWTRPKGSVSGKVNGDVAGGYTVKLRSARYNSNASAEYTAQTASDGTFHFDAVDPGVYTLRAEGKEVLATEYGAQGAGQRGTPIVVNRGAQLKNLTIAPPRLGSICGRVRGASGSASAGLRIFVASLQFGMLSENDRNQNLVTDSDGRFRAEGLKPGDYFVAFLWATRVVHFTGDRGGDAPMAIHLDAGESAGCAGDKPLELLIPEGPDQRHSISGKIGDLPKRVGDRFWVTLAWDVPSKGAVGIAGSAKLDEKHEFRMDRVPNGRFVLELFSGYGPEPVVWSGPFGPVTHLLAKKPVEVRDADVGNVELSPITPSSVSGTVRFEHLPESWKNFDVSAQSITLLPRAYRAPSTAKLSADGSFLIDPEDEGDYEVQMPQPPLYIRSVRLDGREVAGRYFYLDANQAARLEVVVSGDSGEVYSTVAPDASLPRPEPSVVETCGSRNWPQYQLVLFPDPLPTSEPSMTSLPRFNFGGAAGDVNQPTLQAAGVPPGRYRAVAAEHLPPQHVPFGSSNLSSEAEAQLWTAIARLGEPVTVGAAAKVQLVLTDKTIDVARLASKLGLPFKDGR